MTGCVGTWHGCDLEVIGKPAHAYGEGSRCALTGGPAEIGFCRPAVETDTTMRDTCAIHTVLDARRQLVCARNSASNWSIGTQLQRCTLAVAAKTPCLFASGVGHRQARASCGGGVDRLALSHTAEGLCSGGRGASR